jgi:putative nucleotidyltransferase with HDIG domain
MEKIDLTKAQDVLLGYLPLEAHSRRVALLVLEAAKLLKLPTDNITMAAYLHDLGKTTWPPELYNKYPLNANDLSLIHAHPVAGVNVATELYLDLPAQVRELIHAHHERPDGKGYPDGLAEPSVEVLLLAACDTYDNLTKIEGRELNSYTVPIETALMEIAKFAPAKVVAAVAGAVIKIK